MRLTTKALTLGLTLLAGMAFAEVEATDPLVIAQKDLMKTFGGAAKTLGGMAKGEVAFDAAAAEAAKAVLVDGAAKIATVFEKAGVDEASESKADIWTKWDDFAAKAKGLGDAAAAMDLASAETIGAGMGAVGGACKACHTDYREAE